MRSSSVYLLASLLGAGGVATQTPPQEPAPAKQSQQAEAKRPADAAALFAAFRRMPGLEARYTEKKHLALLLVPLESKGRLYFLQPGYLSRVVEAPEKSTLTITPGELRMSGRDGVEVIDLHQSDRLRLFVSSLVQVFRGEQQALTELYAISYGPDGEDEVRWKLHLVPREKPLDQMMKALTLRGRGVAVTSIELVEPNGDRTVTTITAADAEREFTVAERREIFGIRPEAGDGDKAKTGGAKKAP